MEPLLPSILQVADTQEGRLRAPPNYLRLRENKEDILQSRAKAIAVRLVERLIEGRSQGTFFSVSTMDWEGDVVFNWRELASAIDEAAEAREDLRRVENQEATSRVHAGEVRESVWITDPQWRNRTAQADSCRRNQIPKMANGAAGQHRRRVTSRSRFW